MQNKISACLGDDVFVSSGHADRKVKSNPARHLYPCQKPGPLCNHLQECPLPVQNADERNKAVPHGVGRMSGRLFCVWQEE